MHPLRDFLVRVAVLSLVACGGPAGPTPYTNVPAIPGQVAAFSVAPVDLATSGTIVPLGGLSPPGHTIPNDHAGIYGYDFDHPATANSSVRPIVAPAAGAVTFISQAGGDSKIEFRVTDTFYYYLGHVANLDPGLRMGSTVQAGQRLGVTNPGGSIDLGAWDMTVTLPGFVNQNRYGIETLHAVTPWGYFTEPLRSEIYARQRRVPGAPRDARIDLDVAGTLQGNWFHESVPQTRQDTDSPNGWSKSLAFAFDYQDPSLVRVSIGGTVAGPGVWTIPDTAPRPAQITLASGLVAYQLLYTGFPSPYGLMLVQMLTGASIKVQVFVGSSASTGVFDAGAQIYVR